MRGQALLAVTALTAALMSAQPAMAGDYNSYNDAYVSQSRQCSADRSDNTAGGAILGGILGAVVGSHVAANHHRADGAVVGAAGGALLGGAIGNNSRTRACDGPVEGAYGNPQGSYQQGYNDRYDNRYDDRGGYDRGYNDDRRLAGGRYDNDYRDRGDYGYRGRECRWGDIVVRGRDGYPHDQSVWMCRGRDGEWRPTPRY